MDDTQIRRAVDMPALVATKVELQQIGERFHVGLCPFHDEVEPRHNMARIGQGP